MEPFNESESSSQNMEVPIKYESPYGAEPTADNQLESPLKRRLSTEFHEDPGEKRQRIETAKDDLDLAALIAQATASATQQFQVESTAQHESENQQYHNAPVDIVANNNVQQQENNINAGTFSSDPHLYMRILSLPILESLSTQILATLAQGPYEETIRVVTEPSSELGQAYATLRSLFEQTKKIYSQKNSFLSADELNIHETEHRATIRTTNLATFMSGVFGGQDVGFYELDDQFIDSFTPEGGEFKREPGQLYLNFKTQMYISALSQEEQEKSKEEVLDELFPHNLSDILSARHPSAGLLPGEIEFLDDARARREYLMTEGGDADAIQALSERFSWEDFLRSLNAYLRETYESLIAPYLKRHALTAPASPARPTHDTPASHNSFQNPGGQGPNNSDHDAIAQASFAAAQAALQGVGFGQYPTSQPPQQQPQHHHQPQQQQIRTQNSPYQAQPQATYQSHYAGANIPYPTQTAPTQVLYEQARQAAVAKANPHSRRPGLPSQRRPWSTEEENALMAGLDQVKGPHWSQILALYGAKGQISEILKDRNQVQLKDKARNLKLFFLKSNIEVPYYLQCVTGELKTRAPSQAARKEAEERARLASDEEQARFNGIMTLAGGIQQPRQQAGGEHPHTPDPTSQTQSPAPSQDVHRVQDVGSTEQAAQPAPAPEPSVPLSDEEQLRQHLMAATAAATASENQGDNDQGYGQVAPVATMAPMPS